MSWRSKTIIQHVIYKSVTACCLLRFCLHGVYIIMHSSSDCGCGKCTHVFRSSLPLIQWHSYINTVT